MDAIRRFLSRLFRTERGAYRCPSCGEQTADRPDTPCITCEMAVL